MANNIKTIRKSNNMTQEELANILGIEPQSLSNKEAGRRPFTVKEVLIMEELFSVPIRDMFKDKKEEVKKNINRG